MHFNHTQYQSLFRTNSSLQNMSLLIILATILARILCDSVKIYRFSKVTGYILLDVQQSVNTDGQLSWHYGKRLRTLTNTTKDVYASSYSALSPKLVPLKQWATTRTLKHTHLFVFLSILQIVFRICRNSLA